MAGTAGIPVAEARLLKDHKKSAVVPPLAPRRRRKNARTKKPPPPVTWRGEQAKDRIRDTVARLLETRSYRDLRLSDIVEEAGYTIGVFYYYYKDKQSVAVEVLEKAFADDRRAQEVFTRAANSADLFDIVYEATLDEAEIYESHPGLIRSAAQFADDEPALAEAFYRRNQDWTTRIADDLARRFAASGLGRDRAFALASFLNDAVNSFLNQYYVLRNPELRRALKTREEVARFLAICWHRVLFLANPAEAHLGVFGEFARLAPSQGQSLPPAPAGRKRRVG